MSPATETVQQDVLATITRMTESFHAGDIDTVMSTYEEGATVVFQPGMPVSNEPTRNEATLREMFVQATGVKPHFTYSGHEVFVSGDVALHLAPWKMTGTLPDGTEVSDEGLSVAVLRRQSDGRWLMVIDDPHGTALIDGKTRSPW